MAHNGRKIKKANHGSRPCCAHIARKMRIKQRLRRRRKP